MGAASDHPLRVGVLGAAGIAKKNVRGIGKTLEPHRVVVVAVGSRTLAKAEAFLNEMGLKGVKAFASYDAVIDDPNVQAVYIPLPTTLHLQWVKKCAAKGKHVLCEKPIAMDNKTAASLVRLCNVANVQFMGRCKFCPFSHPLLLKGTMWVHGPRAKEIKKAINERYQKDIERVMSVSSLFFFPAPDAFLEGNIRCSKALDGLGCLGDIGWYCVRYSLWAFDYELPEVVQAHLGSKKNGEEVWMRVGATLRWADGRLATFECGFDSAATQHIQISGEKGSVVLEDFCIPLREDQASFKVSFGPFLADYDTRVAASTDTVTVNLDRPQETHMWEAFAKCVSSIEAGGKPEQQWCKESLLTQRVLCAVVESVEAGNRPVTL